MTDATVQVGPDGAGRPTLSFIPTDKITRSLLVEVLAGMLREELIAGTLAGHVGDSIVGQKCLETAGRQGGMYTIGKSARGCADHGDELV